MVMTLDEVKTELKHVNHAIKIIESDRDEDPVRKLKEHRRSVEPWEQKLARLRERYAGAEEMIADHERAIARLKSELRVLDQSQAIEKMRKLIVRLNKLDRGKKIKMVMSRLRMGTQRAVDCMYLIEGHRREIDSLRRLIANDGEQFREQETVLVNAIVAHDTAWDAFAERRMTGERMLERLLERKCELLALERVMKTNDTPQKLDKIFQEFMDLVAQLGPENSKRVLES